MDPQRLGALLATRLAAPVRLRPDRAHAPYRWTTTALRDHAVRAPTAVQAARAASLEVPGVRIGDDAVLTLVIEPGEVTALLATRPCPADLQTARVLLDPDRWTDGLSVRLTRDGTTMPYADLAARVGDAAARWALARSSDGTRVDVPRAVLSSAGLANPVLPVQLARARLAGMPPDLAELPGGGLLLALVAEWPVVVAEAARSGRSRPLVLQLEAVADAALAWLERPPGALGGAGSDPWTAAQLAGAAGSVLGTGLRLAGIPVPRQI